MDLQPIILTDMIKTAIYINNQYYKRKFEKIEGKPLFFKYKKATPKAPYYRLIPMELRITKKIKHNNTKKKLK